ncbi:MAG: hypothetical protein V2A77_06445 [Pseudomonadota bacterium]
MPRLTALLLLSLLAALATECAASMALELRPRLRVEEEYNDNVFLRAGSAASDYITTVYPALDLSARTPTSGVELTYELGYSRYFNQGVNFVRQNGGLLAYRKLTRRLSLEAVDTFYRSEDLLQPGVGTVAPRSTLRAYVNNSASPQLRYRYAPGGEVILNWLNTILENEDPALQDAFGNRGGMEIHHAFSRHDNAALAYSYERADFTQVPALNFVPLPDFVANRANVGYIHNLTRSVSLLGVYDYQDYSFSGETFDNYRTHEGRAGCTLMPAPGWTVTATGGLFKVDGGADMRLGGGLAADLQVQRVCDAGVAGVGYRRGLAEDYYSGENLGVYRYWTASFGFNYFPRRHFNVTLQADGGTREYGRVNRHDDYWDLKTGLVYQIRKWLAAGVRYERYYLKSIPATSDFTNNRYIATIGVSY